MYSGFVKSSYAKKFKKNLPDLYKFTISKTLLKDGESEEVADLILFLLSNNSLYIMEIYLLMVVGGELKL